MNEDTAPDRPSLAAIVARRKAARAVEAEATARRYGGHCKVCGVLRDYHRTFQFGGINHEFVRDQPR